MKVLIVNTPIRPRPTSTPPFGSLALLNYLRRHGEQAEFYNIDGNRPPYDEALKRIVEARPDVLGISAVVSTAYAFTKRLSLDVKRLLPDCLVVVGGNLAASAEVLLNRTGTDICCTGEGEEAFLAIVRRAKETRVAAEFADIPGLAVLGRDGSLLNTGFAPSLPASQVFDIDWDELFASAPADTYINDPVRDDEVEYWLQGDPRTFQPHRRGKKLVTIRCSKGCVARCTFCHRFDKGIRYIPVDLLVERLTLLKERHEVGFFAVGDENFGTDRRWLAEFCEKVKPLDLLWRVSGMRVNCVTPEQIAMMRDAGCVTLFFGMETGSERMLQVMEKKVQLADNYNAMEWTIGAGLYTVVQLVLGMPGETSDTVAETIEFCKFAMTLDARQNPNDLSINYAQALPGTPLYDFARARGLIGGGVDGEEAYLLRVSDKDAHDEVTTLNFTDQPRLVCQMWRPRIQIEVNAAYVAQFGLDHYHRVLLNDTNYFKRKRPTDGFFANPKRLVDRSLTTDSLHDTKDALEVDDTPRLPPLWGLLRSGNLGMALICYPLLAYRLRALLPLLVLLKAGRAGGIGYAASLVAEWARWLVSGRRATAKLDQYRSLRKIVTEDMAGALVDDPAMVPLRRGR
ncbi:MAG: B12-binding domain-containing radical SAM protein [Actinomycetota bacterium]